MITAISRYRIRSDGKEEVRQTILNWREAMERMSGFCGFDVLTELRNSSTLLLISRWEDEAAFRIWDRDQRQQQQWESGGPAPKDSIRGATFTAVTVGCGVEDSARIQTLGAAVESRPIGLSRWLMKSDAVFAAILSPDGTIRVHNRACNRFFPSGSGKANVLRIWDYLVDSDAELLRRRFAATKDQHDSGMILNLANRKQCSERLRVALIHCGVVFLLLGTAEDCHDDRLRREMSKRARNLEAMMRRAARTNIELKEANATIDRLAREDPLTGLANRRMLSETLAREIARAQRLVKSLSVIMADLDGFKMINDACGHIVGDKVLQSVAGILSRRKRRSDLAARFGGDEFVILLPDTPRSGAVKVAERIRDETKKLISPAHPFQISISFGIATWISAETPEEFLDRADLALYRAKRIGPNQIVAMTDIPV